ncbi:MAG: RagB/SusD family nutrient uptake outer membrane protein [Bacteroidota bacterium]
MKKIIYISIVFAAIAIAVACNEEFLDLKPQGVLSEDVLQSDDGVEALLIAAYSALDTWSGWAVGAPWESAASNWVMGDVYSDDAYKGTDVNDQPPINPMERYEHQADNPYVWSKWAATYDAVSRTNDLLRVLGNTEDITQDASTQILAEGRFLRAHYHFELKKVYDNITYLDETTDVFSSNTTDIWPNIEADLEFAVANLPNEPRNGQKGRATKYAAQALLAKVHLFQNDPAAAKSLLDAVINSGQYSLTTEYHENFRISGDNNSESIFQLQASVNGASFSNGNLGDILNFTHTGGPGGCCGFHQPSQNLVNVHKTTAEGFPMFDTFNNEDLKNDQGLLPTDDFEPTTDPLDPRLDWSVGRRGIPYLDWGDHNSNWVRDQSYGGPYSPKKMVYYQAEAGTGNQVGYWGGGLSANNYSFIRYADVLLWRAEVAVSENDLNTARTYVNMVRARAANPDTWVMRGDTAAAANYVISEYPENHTMFTSKDNAEKAVQYERRIELAMEGHRFFDLVRWGIAKETIDAYLEKEKTKRTYLQGANFDAYNVRHPIPRRALIRSIQGGAETLVQNEGYN